MPGRAARGPGARLGCGTGNQTFVFADQVGPTGRVAAFDISAQATLTACRPLPGASVESILACEVASSTDWAGNHFGAPFVPNHYVEISATLKARTAALAAYQGEMRSFPHPRSPQALEALARRRGAEAGLPAAEAFVILRSIRPAP